MPALEIRSPARRRLLLAISAIPLTSACTSTLRHGATAQQRLLELEAVHGGRLGVMALNTANGARLSHRADERFPVCSTFKMMAAAAILERSARDPALLQQIIHYTAGDLVTHSPITATHLADGMTVADLCAATIQYSDNAAANLLMKLIGGPAGVTAFARSIGDTMFRLDRWETELNTAIPGDPRDTSTPTAMANSLHRLVLGDALGQAQQAQLQTWLRGNTTGDTRIRAGVPAGWQVGDKTGGGDYGTNNHIAVLWPPGAAPIILALYHTQSQQKAEPRNALLAEATRVVVAAFSA